MYSIVVLCQSKLSIPLFLHKPFALPVRFQEGICFGTASSFGLFLVETQQKLYSSCILLDVRFGIRFFVLHFQPTYAIFFDAQDCLCSCVDRRFVIVFSITISILRICGYYSHTNMDLSNLLLQGVLICCRIDRLS